jgi:hypothetical protein
MIAYTTVVQVGLVTIDQMKQTQGRALLEREKQLSECATMSILNDRLYHCCAGGPGHH